jgi:benzylsuccinate CoA-transferase BbsF subunit
MSKTPLTIAHRAPHIGEHNDEVYTELRNDSKDTLATLRQKEKDRRYAFEGIKVVDFAWVGVGPITGKYLADHGATVIRIESRARPDILRQAPPWTDGEPGLDRSQFFASFNTSKHGITLDLGQPKAQELAKKLIAWTDVALESFTPKAMRNWGLDYQELRKINPELIMLSTCQQGQTGPHALYPGFGNLMASLTGFYHISGWPDRDPAPPYGAYTDFIAPRFGATALMAALDYRRRTGKGQYIDMAQSEAALHFLSPALLDYQVNGRVLNREGNRSFRSAPHGVYRCQGEDRWLAISASDDAQWQGLLKTLGNPTWGSEARFATQSGRLEHPEALDELVGTWAAEQEAEAAADTLQQAGVPAGVVQNCLDLHQDPRLAAWNMFQYLDHKAMGPSPYEGHQFHLSKTPGELRWPAPIMGQHNEQVFGEILGLSPEEIAQLTEDKVIY